MAIIIDENTKVLVQGITGREGSFHTQKMIEYGTKVVAGTSPSKGGTEIFGIPVFATVREAREKTGANASVIFVPASFAAAAIREAAAGGIETIICVTEGIPLQDMISVVEYVRQKGARLIGPNCPGVVSVGIGKLGIIPGSILTKGSVGIVSRSGTLTYEIINNLTALGIGQSTCVGIGGDPILGTRFKDVLPLFEADPQTSAVVMVGEIGGSDEEEAGAIIRTMKKPVIGFISGRTAPQGKRMGHAGAIISGESGTVQSKEKALLEAGVLLANSTAEVAQLVKKLF